MIVKKCSYYLNEAKAQNWTVRNFERNIKTGYCNRILSRQPTVLSPLDVTDKINNFDFLKDPYMLVFLGLPENNEGKESHL
jgi:predicted nuclease of restriction endonuclease-like (RecB) superfamily